MLLSCYCHAILSSMTASSGLNISPINSQNRLILVLLCSQGLTQGALAGSTPKYTYNFRNYTQPPNPLSILIYTFFPNGFRLQLGELWSCRSDRDLHFCWAVAGRGVNGIRKEGRKVK